MGEPRALVAFANQAGSTATIADAIATVLRCAGIDADCRLASDVTDLGPYDAVILGSGVFMRRRRADGGGFLVRHRAALGDRAVWLFCAGPIGRGRCPTTGTSESDECSVIAVARAIGARGAAIFGPIGLPSDADPLESLGPVNSERVRAWATEIAADLRATPRPPVRVGRPPAVRCDHLGATG